MFELFKRFSKDERGATAIEYGLIAAVISISMISGASLVGGSIDSMFFFLSNEFDTMAE